MLLRILLCTVGAMMGVDRGRADPYYQLVRKIENPAGPIDGSGDEFGISLAQVGENFVVGAYREDTGALNAGAAYVFDRDGNLLTTIHNPTPAPDDWFGFEVRAVEDKILVAARGDSTGGFDSGSVYLYDQQGMLLQTITNPTPAIDDDFGNRVLGVGENILVTAWKDDTMSVNAGAAYLFDQQGSLLQEFFSPNPIGYFFGRSVASVGDDRVLISAYAEPIEGHRQAGAAYLFDLQGNLLQSFFNPEPDNDDFFGIGVAGVGNDHVVIAAIEHSPSSTTGGTAYVYDTEGNLLQTLPNPTPEVQDWFGRTMINVGDELFLIGAVFDKTLGDNTGAAYLFNTAGELIQTFLPPEPSPGGHFSSDLATLDELILIGSHFDGGRFTGPGAVYVYAPLPPLAGDYNADQLVDQADLDFVLLNWGVDASDRPDAWVRNLPRALIDQQELDDVLLNWGRTTIRPMAATGVPEPSGVQIMGVVAALAVVSMLRRKLRDRIPLTAPGLS